MTDGQAMRIAKQIEALNEKVRTMCYRLASEHPNGSEIIDALQDNAICNPAQADDVVHGCLLEPSAWEKRHGSWRHIAAAKAAANRN